MHFSYFEDLMALLGLASIAIGSFAERLTEHVLRKPETTPAERFRHQSPH